MAVNYAFIDAKLGLTSSGAKSLGTIPWAPLTPYVVGQIVQNGGFSYRCSVAGNSAALAAAPQSSGPAPNQLADGTVTWVRVAAISSVCGQDAVAAQELGYQAIAKDPVYGTAFFRYVKFTGPTNPGDFVIVDQVNQLATQTPAAAPGAGKVSILGISMGQQINGSFGWVLIQGVHDQANVAAAGVVGNTLQGSAVVGQASTAVVVNYIFDGTVLRNAGLAGMGVVEFYWPVCSGR
jgi:hypothetical protein